MSATNRISLVIAILALAAAALFAPPGGALMGDAATTVSDTAATLGASLVEPSTSPWEAVTELARLAVCNARHALAAVGLPWCF